MTEVSAPNLLDLVFARELKAGASSYDAPDEATGRRVEAQNRAALDRFLDGFVPGDLESFREWLSTSRRFVSNTVLIIPAVVSVAKLVEGLHVSPDTVIPVMT